MRRSSISLNISEIVNSGTAATKNVRIDFKSKNVDEVLTLPHAIHISGLRSGTGKDVLTPSELPTNAASFCYSVPGNSDCDGLGTQSGNILDYCSMRDTYRTQLFTPYGSTNLHFRTQNGDNNGSWNPWYKIYHTGYKPIPIDIGAPTYVGTVDFGRSSGPWTTTEFIDFIKGSVITSNTVNGYWICKGSWSYASNKTIADASTGCGNIPLAGSTVEIYGSTGFFMVRITTPTTSSPITGNGMDGKNSVFTYIDNGPTYRPGWRRDYNSLNPPTAEEIGAFPINMYNLPAYPPNGVPWNAKTGMYFQQMLDSSGRPSASSLILNFLASENSGSTRSAQFCVNYRNGGLFYRSSRDAHGFELPFARIYTEVDKPSASDIGAIPINGGNYNGAYRLTQIGCIPKERNTCGLDSFQTRDTVFQPNNFVNYTWYEWYNDRAYTGIVRSENTKLASYRISVARDSEEGIFDFNPLGDFQASRNGNFNDVYIRSDIRDKTDIKVMNDPIARLSKIVGTTYKVKSKNGWNTSGGVIAQHVLNAVPELVTKDKNFEGKERYRVNYNGLIGLLINGINSLSHKHDLLVNEVTNLKAMLKQT